MHPMPGCVILIQAEYPNAKALTCGWGTPSHDGWAATLDLNLVPSPKTWGFNIVGVPLYHWEI